MKRSGKWFTALAVAAVSVSACSMSVSAAEVKDVFDASYYADSYADLKEAFGYDEGALLQHYMTYGLNEGRVASTVLNVAEYRAAYADLEEAFGDDWNAYVNHYYTYGITEGRTAGVYGENNPAPSGPATTDNTAVQPSAVQPPADQLQAGQQTANQQVGSEIWVPASGTEGVFAKYEGVFDNNGTPVNVTINYSDVRVADYMQEYEDIPAGCEYQDFSVEVDVHDADVAALQEALVRAIGFDQASVQNLAVTYDGGDGDKAWTCTINYNGKTYESRISVEWYRYTGSSEGIGMQYFIRVPQGYRLTTTVQLDANTVVKHKHQ
ncbi:MAG: hypothetical protein NC409_05635 [Clostridium sp.]|nr:hypothetical protein [Clostridium sp.]